MTLPGIIAEVGTRQRLLRAAVEAIEAGGEEAVHLRDIGAAAGVTTPTIYHFFGSRAGLIIEAQAWRFKESLTSFTPTAENLFATCHTVEDVESAFRTIALAIFHPDRSIYRMVRLEAMGSAMSRPMLRERLSQVMCESNAEFAGVIEGLQQRNLLRRDVTAMAMASFFTSAVFARTTVEFDTVGCVDPDAWNALMLDSVMAAIFGPR